MRIKNATPEKRAKVAQLASDVEAYDALRKRAKNALAAKPKMCVDVYALSSAAVALAQDIKSGAYTPGRSMADTLGASDASQVASDSKLSFGGAESYQGKRAARGLL